MYKMYAMRMSGILVMLASHQRLANEGYLNWGLCLSKLPGHSSLLFLSSVLGLLRWKECILGDRERLLVYAALQFLPSLDKHAILTQKDLGEAYVLFWCTLYGRDSGIQIVLCDRGGHMR